MGEVRGGTGSDGGGSRRRQQRRATLTLQPGPGVPAAGPQPVPLVAALLEPLEPWKSEGIAS